MKTTMTLTLDDLVRSLRRMAHGLADDIEQGGARSRLHFARARDEMEETSSDRKAGADVVIRR